jgi:hypothetical protein
MAIEDDFRAALIARAEALLETAALCIGAAMQSPIQYGISLSAFQGMRHDLTRVEALDVGIVNRVGISWDAMAGELNQSRQALHRRLARASEEEFASARLSSPRAFRPLRRSGHG